MFKMEITKSIYKTGINRGWTIDLENYRNATIITIQTKGQKRVYYKSRSARRMTQTQFKKLYDDINKYELENKGYLKLFKYLENKGFKKR